MARKDDHRLTISTLNEYRTMCKRATDPGREDALQDAVLKLIETGIPAALGTVARRRRIDSDRRWARRIVDAEMGHFSAPLVDADARQDARRALRRITAILSENDLAVLLGDSTAAPASKRDVDRWRLRRKLRDALAA